jgi:spore maturation protein CgeB
MRYVQPEEGKLWNLHVFYVKEGFTSLDDGIVEALQSLAREVTTLHEGEDAAGLAGQLHPDLVIVLNGTRFPLAQVDALRAQGIRTAIWLVDDPYHTDMSRNTAPHYDDVFTHEINCVSFYRELGCPSVHYLPLAASLQSYAPRNVELPFQKEICFIANGFENRIAFIDQIAPFLARKKTFIAGWWWDRLRNYGLLQDKIKLNSQWMPPEEASSYYNGAKIVINLHRSDQDPANFNSVGIAGHSINPRTYEICATGAFQLTDSRADLPQLYRPGIDLATYESPQDFIEKASYYLEHDQEREAIAIRGFHRTLQEHTYRKRLTALLQLLFP